jgi:hypothetical protein
VSAKYLPPRNLGGRGAACRYVLSSQRIAQEREHVLAEHGVHLARREVLEARPAQVLVRAAAAAADAVAALRKDSALHRRLEPGRPVLLQRVQVVQPAQEERVGDLLDHLQRVRDAALPERVPDGVDLVLDVAGDHARCSMLLILAVPSAPAAAQRLAVVACIRMSVGSSAGPRGRRNSDARREPAGGMLACAGRTGARSSAHSP